MKTTTNANATTQEWLNVKDVRENLLYSKDGYVFAYFSLEPLTVELMTESEKRNSANLLASIIASESEPFQILKVPKPVDVSAIINSLQQLKLESKGELHKRLFSEEIRELDRIALNSLSGSCIYVVKIWAKTSEVSLLKNRRVEFSKKWEDGGIKTNVLTDKDIIKFCSLYTHPVYVQYEDDDLFTQYIPIVRNEKSNSEEVRSFFESKNRKNDDVNYAVLNAIAPSQIEFKRNSMAVGEKFIKGYGVIKYAPKVNLGWLSKIVSTDNTIVSILFTPNPSGELLQAVSKNIRYQQSKTNTSKNYIELQRAETGVENGKELIRRMDNLGESVGYFSIAVLALGTDEKSLNATCKNVEAVMTGLNFKLRPMAALQKECYQFASPYFLPNEKIINCTKVIMPLSSFMLGLPCTTSNFSDETGTYFGRDESNGLICLDLWKRGGDRTNSNMVVLGQPGQGKSFAVKHIIESQFMLGTKILILDPDSEYREITRNFGGDVIDVGGSKDGKINPLQMKVNGNDDENTSSDLALHLKNVDTFFDLYLPEINVLKRSKLKDTIIEEYAKKGITFETKASDISNDEYPVMKDIYEALRSKVQKENDDYDELSILLKDIAVGSDSFLWNGKTSIHSDAQIICLDINNLKDAPDNIKRTQYHNILTWAWEQASRDRDEKVLIICDEAYLTIDDKVPQALISLRNFAKRGRKYSVGIIIISHSVVDFLSPSVKQYGQELLGNTAYKIFFGCDGKSLKELAELYDLKDPETEFLLRREQRKALVTIGSKRMKVKFALDYKAKYLTGGGA